MSDTKKMKIYYTKTDEAPALATHSFLPIVQAMAGQGGIPIEIKDISLAGRILCQFPGAKPGMDYPDALQELGALAKTPEANIIKLPNISASIPQLKEAILELQTKGFSIPDFPESPTTDEEKENRAKYAKVLGSAVNPVLREGNSDRRVAKAVKEYAKANPHSMGKWTSDSKSFVAHMKEGDFYSSEQSYVSAKTQNLKLMFKNLSGEEKELRAPLSVLESEIVDAAVMSVDALKSFYKETVDHAKNEGLLLSLHLKATMMKVSDPILFGHAVETFFSSVFKKYTKEFTEVGIRAKYGLEDLFTKIKKLPSDVQSSIESDIKAAYELGPKLAMVDSDKGITNFHMPNDVIIDASMPAALRSSGKMWGPDGQLHDMVAMIPDRSYAGLYQEVFNFCRENGAFDVTTMGNVSNVGLMAKKAQEYGSHDKTFEIVEDGEVVVYSEEGEKILEHKVKAGDIWRMCQTKDVAVKDWVRLAVQRAKTTNNPAIFWLDEARAHDRNLIQKVQEYLKNYDVNGLDIQILSPVKAMSYTLKRSKQGLDTISVTGNVLRDYLTDLFPILELGTSAKMLSIVPLLAGGGLYETGAGGSAPKHVQQFVEEGHLRWDSLGEFLALSVSLEELGEKIGSSKVKALAEALEAANVKYLKENKSPSRKVKELDNRGSHFYLFLFWSEALAHQSHEPELQETFKGIYAQLKESENQILSELNEAQGSPVDIGGYYLPDDNKVKASMRPSPTLNQIIEQLN